MTDHEIVTLPEPVLLASVPPAACGTVTSGSCAELSSPETLAQRGIAFDGTVRR